MSRTEEEWQAVEIASAVWKQAIAVYDRDICSKPISYGEADGFLTHFNRVSGGLVQIRIAETKAKPRRFHVLQDLKAPIDWSAVEELVSAKLNRMCIVFVAIVREDNPEFSPLSAVT